MDRSIYSIYKLYMDENFYLCMEYMDLESKRHSSVTRASLEAYRHLPHSLHLIAQLFGVHMPFNRQKHHFRSVLVVQILQDGKITFDSAGICEHSR